MDYETKAIKIDPGASERLMGLCVSESLAYRTAAGVYRTDDSVDNVQLFKCHGK